MGETSPTRKSGSGTRLSTVQRLGRRVETMRATVDPTVAAFRDPARLAWSLWLDALRRDLRARLATGLLLALAALTVVSALTTAPARDPRLSLLPPSASHLLGTDMVGRDLLAALVQGALPTIGVGALAALGAGALGVALGALAGFLRGTVDAMVHRAIETLSAVPSLLLVLVVQAFVPLHGAASLLIVIVATRWSEVAIAVRADVLRVLQQDHVTAARALGASPSRVLARHVMPLALSTGGVSVALGFGGVVAIETAVSAVGVGSIHPMSWGALLGSARAHPEAWWLIAFPMLLVGVTVGASLLLGEAMRDALDPHARAAQAARAAQYHPHLGEGDVERPTPARTPAARGN